MEQVLHNSPKVESYNTFYFFLEHIGLIFK